MNKLKDYLCVNPFSINLDRRAESCNTINNLSNKVSVPNKTEYLNLRVFNMFTGINESKILKKHISCKCKSKFKGIKCNSNHKWNNDDVGVSVNIRKKIICGKKIIPGNLLHVVAKMVNI